MPPGAPAAPVVVVEWTIRPWQEDPARAALAVIAALFLWLLAAWLLPGERLLATVLGGAALLVLAPGMAPTQCRVDGSGVARRVLFAWERRAWPEIRRARVGAHGLFVSPFARRCRLDRFRGLFLPVPRRAADSAPLIEALRQEVGRRGL
jgi:hypothetical protein